MKSAKGKAENYKLKQTEVFKIDKNENKSILLL